MPDNNHKTTVLVGFAEALSAPEAVWSLVDGGFRVVAFSRRGRRAALRHSRHVQCHEITPPTHNLPLAIEDLDALIVSLRKESGAGGVILMPLDDTAIWMCSRVALQTGCLLAGPQGENAELALNKHFQIREAQEAGLNVPETLVANSGEILSAGLSFPIIIKSANAVEASGTQLRGKGSAICSNRDELERSLSRWDRREHLLVQPFILGTGEGVFGIATPHGIKSWSSHRRLRMMNPAGSGSSACISQQVPCELKPPIERFIKNTGWQGLFMIELLRDFSGKIWFMEINGRSWGSMALARRQGLEYPAWGASLVLHGEPQVSDVTRGEECIVSRHLGREIMHLLFVLRGPRSKAQTNWPSLWKAVCEIAPIRSRQYFYNWRKDDPKVFISDLFYTIYNEVFG